MGMQKPAKRTEVAEEYWEKILATPEWCIKALERNTKNRDLRDWWVKEFELIINRGEWQESHQGFAIAPNGDVIDGQHRMWAIVNTGKAVTVWVQYNALVASRETIDTHADRTIRDVICMQRPGERVSARFISAATRMILGFNQSGSHGSGPKVTRKQVIGFIDRNTEAIAFSLDCLKGARKRVGQAAIVAVVARASYSADHTRLREFGKVLVSGMTESPNDRAAIVLRNWLFQETGTQVLFMKASVVYAKAERALEAFLRGENLTRLYEAKQEIFDMPKNKRIPS